MQYLRYFAHFQAIQETFENSLNRAHNPKVIGSNPIPATIFQELFIAKGSSGSGSWLFTNGVTRSQQNSAITLYHKSCGLLFLQCFSTGDKTDLFILEYFY